MPLHDINWPGKVWEDIPHDKLPKEIHDYYTQHHTLVCAKRSCDNRIVLFFNDVHFDDETEVWQTLEGVWVHIGPRRRK